MILIVPGDRRILFALSGVRINRNFVLTMLPGALSIKKALKGTEIMFVLTGIS